MRWICGPATRTRSTARGPSPWCRVAPRCRALPRSPLSSFASACSLDSLASLGPHVALAQQKAARRVVRPPSSTLATARPSVLPPRLPISFRNWPPRRRRPAANVLAPATRRCRLAEPTLVLAGAAGPARGLARDRARVGLLLALEPFDNDGHRRLMRLNLLRLA